MTPDKRIQWKASGLLAVLILLLTTPISVSCNTSGILPDRTGEGTPQVSSDDADTSSTVNDRDEFDIWWQEYKRPIHLDTSSYPAFLRGAWASRLDEARRYLLNIESLRNGGFDTIMLGIDIVFDPETGDAKSLGDDLFIFYLQAFKKAGFRVIVIPNPMHPNLDMGKGYDWEGTDPSAGYQRSYELLEKLDTVVIKWARIAQQYHADGFVPLNEPFKLVLDYRDVSKWLQKILPEIKEVYEDQTIALDTMLDLGQGRSIPYPYDYSGYDIILGGPPCGWKDIEQWEQMINEYISKGNQYVQDYYCEGFGLYEWGSYTGGIWYEPIAEDQVLDQDQARLIVEAMVREADGTTIASFPRISKGWSDLDTPAFEAIGTWYKNMGEETAPLEKKLWTYPELNEIEQNLAGDEYDDIFQIAEPSPYTFPIERPSLSIPEDFKLTDFTTTHTGDKITLSQNTKNHIFNNCEVLINAENITVSDSKFINSSIIVDNTANVSFEKVILSELNQYEQAALTINNSHEIVINNSKISNNYIGVGIHDSSVDVNQCRFEYNNGHNALVIGEGSAVNVDGNYFYGSFPHAILIMNREEDSNAVVNISRNYIDQTGEDAINFEDYRNATPSRVSGNVIMNSGWAAIIVEYNSWEAGITIEGNWIENTGIDWKLTTHVLQQESFQPGWGHGVLVEDSSQVRVSNNRVLLAGQNGIEIRNSREVVVEGNGIDCSQVGIGVYRYNESSLYREVSPLGEENAGSSQGKADNNVVFSAARDYYIEKPCQFIITD